MRSKPKKIGRSPVLHVFPVAGPAAETPLGSPTQLRLCQRSSYHLSAFPTTPVSLITKLKTPQTLSKIYQSPSLRPSNFLLHCIASSYILVCPDPNDLYTLQVRVPRKPSSDGDKPVSLRHVSGTVSG